MNGAERQVHETGVRVSGGREVETLQCAGELRTEDLDVLPEDEAARGRRRDTGRQDVGPLPRRIVHGFGCTYRVEGGQQLVQVRVIDDRRVGHDGREVG